MYYFKSSYSDEVYCEEFGTLLPMLKRTLEMLYHEAKDNVNYNIEFGYRKEE